MLNARGHLELCKQVLGKRLGKAMGAVGKAIQGMTRSQVAEYEASGTVTLGQHQLEAGDIKVPAWTSKC